MSIQEAYNSTEHLLEQYKVDRESKECIRIFLYS
jgi:hypothetical protein